MRKEISDQIRDYVETAAPAISLAELAKRRTAARRSDRRALGRRPPLPRRIIFGAVTGAMVAGGAVAAGLALAGGGQVRPADVGIRLSAAMVHQVTTASNEALASAGHVFVTFSAPELAGSAPHVSGTIDITFSGHDFNAVSMLPQGPTGSTSPRRLIIRVVNGQVYTLGIVGASGRRQQWHHFSNYTESGRVVPDPRRLLRVLRPDAGFEFVGPQFIGGVQTKHLRATQLTDLPASLMSSLTFVSVMGPQRLTGLDVWVDSHDVVRQMSMTFSSRSPQGRLVWHQTVRFLDIGKPEAITAPAHYVTTHG